MRHYICKCGHVWNERAERGEWKACGKCGNRVKPGFEGLAIHYPAGMREENKLPTAGLLDYKASIGEKADVRIPVECDLKSQ